ncbi:MAG: NACHT domain-containing protein [Pseudomonas sp.]|uniref:NACHT domain-containing protein n=1 Tax=Pseudomonas sp. TaxID=306 RepID=UPI001DC76AD4|nr:NACHT domain-containing protein [Pseudomonas sp.]MPT02461.1 NACHT domain-containing protein [Pseudomonas sp.]
MAESGGPTTQSGIYYQNSITALYLGALLDTRPPVNGHSRVISVRVEAPEDIDDIVVNYANGSVLYIQVKEQLALQGEAWVKFWSSAKKQSETCRTALDQFRLVLGTFGAALENFRETLERAQGKENIGEWRNALNREHSKIADLILNALSLPDDDAFLVIKRTRAEFMTLSSAETSGVRDWMPHASEKPSELYSRLRDCCGGAARVRHTFRASELSEMLFRKFRIRVFGTHSDGLERYSEAIATQVDHIGVPGTSISMHQDDLLVWPNIVCLEKAEQANFDDEDPWRAHRDNGDRVDLRDFPTPEMRLVILESGAGHGKSTLLRATVRRLAKHTTFVPAFIHAERLPDHPTIQDYLNTDYNAQYQVTMDWTALCEQGRAVMFIDGVDELNDSSRAALVNMIGRAVARFPDMPVLVGARDASVTSFPPQFKLFRLQRLDDDQMIQMLRAYFRARGEFDIQRSVKHVQAYEELYLLCRTPLFLAIYAATLPKNGVIPTSRSEVLELYILHALSPERHKGVGKSIIGKSQLRRGAEAIALLSLERNEAAVPESIARLCLSKALGDPVGDDCIDALVQNGLLERRGARLAFSIPTIQEYLAGCVLAYAGRLDADDWLENVYRRPWAQAIQFAVEKIDNADALLRRQIERDDDIFYTSLRLAARCIVNGASVSSDLREMVASKLAHALTKGGHQIRIQIGNLIADGFCKPLHPDIRSALIKSGRDIYERASILVRVSESELMLECLKTVLKGEDIRELWDLNWCRAIKLAKNESLELLLDRARKEVTSTLPSAVIAEVLFQLREEPSINWKAIVADETLPLVVRSVATFFVMEYSDGSQSKLIEAAFEEAEYRSLWRSFSEAYMATSWWKAHFCGLCRLEKTGGHVHALSYLKSGGEEEVTSEIIDLLSKVANDPLTHPGYRYDIQSVLGSLGLLEFAETATDTLVSADINQIHSWIRKVPYFSDAVVRRGVEIIFSRALQCSDMVGIIEDLYSSTMYVVDSKIKKIHLGGPFTIRKSPREVGGLILSKAEELIKEVDAGSVEEIKLLLICAKSGLDWSIKQLVLHIDIYLSLHDQIKDEDWNDWFAQCIMTDAIDLEINTLWLILSKGTNLPMHGIVERIIAKEGSSTYSVLADFVNKNPKSSAWQAVYFYFERNASREGLNIRFQNGKLEITKVS